MKVTFHSSILLMLNFIASIYVAQINENQKVFLHEKWSFHQLGKNKSYQAKIPSVIHTDLLKNKLIEDPFIGNNEQELQWIENEDWVYSTQFQLNDQQLNSQHIELVFEGLDTYADVYLNNELILVGENMFFEYKKGIKPYLKIGNNELKVIFHSPLKKNKESVKNYPYELPAGCETVSLKVSPFTRKAAYHFGWDWGPRFVTMGIWKPVYIHLWNDVKINHVQCKTKEIKKSSATVLVNIELAVGNNDVKKCALKINDTILSIDLNKGINNYNYEFNVINPKLWWTHDLGDPYLYDLSIDLYNDSKLIQSKKIKYGIRTIELINEKDKIGTSFYFKLNGKPVFMKGANYIPQHSFLTEVSDSNYHELIGMAKNANMNMLRVWGGGIYEKEIFYDLCDQKGILVWQDMMFAGSLYPTNNLDFNNSVYKEIAQNIIRLRNHPCIALWCGNNEIEVAWKNWGWQKQYNYSTSDSTEIWNGYKKLFHDSIPAIIARLDSRSYTTTSPLSNWGKAENFNHSTMHYWGVWHGKEDFSEFKNNIGRFMVEYGFQSYPSITTIDQFANKNEQDLDHTIMKNRQKSYIGNGMITEHIEKWIGKHHSFEDFVIKSQQTQAIALKTAIQHHRKNQPHCMGTLFWQLNDCWPGPSWSIIDHYGTPKLAYEVIKNEFQPIIAVIDTNDDFLTTHLINNGGKARNLNVKISLLNSYETLWTEIKEIKITNNQSDVILNKAYKYQKGLRALIEVKEKEKVIYKNVFWFDAPKNR